MACVRARNLALPRRLSSAHRDCVPRKYSQTHAQASISRLGLWLRARETVDLEFLGIFIDEGIDILTTWEATCIEIEKHPSPDLIEALFRAAHNLKGSSRSVGLIEFGHVVHRIEDVINKMRDGDLLPDASVVGFLLQCQAFLRDWLADVRSNPEFVPHNEHILEHCKAFVESDNATLGTAPRISPADATSTAVQPGSKAGAGKAEKPATSAATPRADETIRISAQKLDFLLQLIGELSIHQAIIWHARQTGNLEQKAALNSIHLSAKITREAQAQALNLRMQPLAGLFQRLERTARDVARNQDKAMQVEVEGAQVELDKTVIEHMTDPLVHVLRNAVDHGVETRIERGKTSKDAVAKVSLIATQETSGVEISVQDDGRGLDPARILAKARQRGLVAEDAILSDEQVFQLIFLPGFSTAEQVTDVSGRGVGMDVVRKTVDKLGGTIRIRSQLGKGTTITIAMPTSLSIIDALVVDIGGTSYAVPMSHLEEIIDLSAYPMNRTVDGGRSITLRGRVLPYEPLARFLVTAAAVDVAAAPARSALVARLDGASVILGIDRVIRQQQVVVRPLSRHLSKIPGFGGGTILPDGEPGLIIDIASAIRTALNRQENAIA